MTTGEHLVDISTLSTGTALNHFLNISGGGGETIYIPIEEVNLLLENENDMVITLEELDFVDINLEENIEVNLVLEDNNEITIELEDNNEINIDTSCQ